VNLAMKLIGRGGQTFENTSNIHLLL
jgi:hypothetical protein